ncbi:hypothetical protein [Paractinoplanes durhamensis]|uniref:Uncharacterized protein n=1 Tax=Paractinoplanes durhamensis TaxID=113563 RepID=A0ABQ3ZA07_9ACTN|nr:hypothetical protein [Actinoplanes durhamensis]GIE06621.1 hypothetical protein Adu01nite_79710 [Actinoplanes durhamensis]
MSEPLQDSPLVRAGETDGFDNPILYIEELRRLPLNRSQVPAVGSALVFRTRSGRLHAPAGGYSAGEMFFLGPRTGYQIDITPHGFRAEFEIGSALAAEVEGRWTVVDPVAVVANRISDVEYACTTVLGERMAAALPAKVDDAEEARERLTAALAEELPVPGGVRLDELRVAVTAVEVLTGERVLHLLMADQEDADPGDPGGSDPGQLLLELSDLARQGLAEHGADGTAGRALARFQELVIRMGDMLPPGDDRAGDDRPG